MNDQSNEQKPKRSLFSAEPQKPSPINAIGLIYILFLILFPFSTINGYSFVWYVLSVPLVLISSILIAVKFKKGLLKFKQIALLAFVFVLIWLSMPDAGDSSSYQGIEVLIGRFRGIDVLDHFLPTAITSSLSVLCPIFAILFIGLSVYFLKSNPSHASATK